MRQHYEKNGIRTTCWTVWQTDSERDLEDIVEYFLVQGMKQGIKSDSKANYLYVFWLIAEHKVRDDFMSIYTVRQLPDSIKSFLFQK